jgi:hypothetical protein
MLETLKQVFHEGIVIARGSTRFSTLVAATGRAGKDKLPVRS